MTDKDKLKALLSEFGVGFADDGNRIICKDGPVKVSGCRAFYTTFKFDANGKFIAMGAYE